MIHHPDQLTELARLRRTEVERAALRRPAVDVVSAGRRDLLGALRRFLARRPVEPEYVREFRIA